jgi:lipopolysaccharide/colanic/teichoic acid biosynthesis glycosyltransferase
MNQYFARNAQAIRSHYSLPFEFDAPSFRSVRRVAIDLTESLLALVLLVLSSPVLAICFVAIRLTSRGPVLYRQVRVGRDGKPFTLLKLRSMRLDAEKETGPILSWKSDPRVTTLGNFLRKSHLDELPQLWNVLRGDMALVGPRPERPYFVNQYRNEVPRYRDREQVKPGITGLAQVCCGYDATPEQKLEFDLLYIRHRHSIAIYVLIFYYTAKKVLFAAAAS